MTRSGPSLLAIALSLFVLLSLFGCTASDMAGRPTDTPPEPAEAEGSRPPMLLSVDTQAAGRQTRVVLQGDKPMTYTAVLDKASSSIILDLGAATGPATPLLTPVNNGLVDKVTIEQPKDNDRVLRVQIALRQPTSYQVIREESNLVVLVENMVDTAASDMDIEETPLTPAQMAGGTAKIDDVGFTALGQTGRTRLVIKTNKVVTPQVLTRDNGKTVVLSVSPAYIPPQLIRPLDTGYFRSSVDFIKPMQASGQSVEFVIRLRGVTPFHLGQKGLVTFVDFDQSAIPPKAAQLTRPGMPVPTEAALPAGSVASAAMSTADQPSSTTGQKPKVYSGQKISLDFQNADIHNILRLIGEVSGKNVVVSDRVAGKVTLKLKEVPWDQALDIVLKANNLDVDASGNVLRIDTAESIRTQRELARQEKVQAKESVELVKKVFTPKYAAVALMKDELAKLKTERGKLTIIGNDIYVEEEPSVLASMQEVFDRNDKTAKQILIESRIVEATSNFSKSLGVNWGGDASRDATSGLLSGKSWDLYGAFDGGTAGAGGAAVNLITAPTTGLALGFGLIGNTFNIDAKLYAMEQTGEGRIVSAPRILASNDQEVYIKQGQSIPYESSGTTTSPSTITYQEAVLELRVKPHIEENGKIISMDLTVTKDSPDYATSTTNPPINKREAKTRLMVKNGETVVIGGIIVDEKSKTINRVPGLHRIPILGWLFKDYEVSDAKTELLIFLTSNIIPVKI